MPTLPGVHICTTDQHAGKAGAIIAKMENLLDKRRTRQVTRQGFLIGWGKLRTALRLTKDYADLIERVKARAKNICEFCGERYGSQVHHIEPVAFAPRLVLLDINCKWTCTLCHPSEDKKDRLKARRNGKVRNFTVGGHKVARNAQ